ncbi:MAG: fructose 1,6-bisphosphatase [Chloroflexi bacterium]|nr:fructose 1,6-bisphosphatase [Chloroflexota bacterium]
MITLSVIKADIGGWVGHSNIHPDLAAEATNWMERARQAGILVDYHVTHCGDDLQLIMTHERGNLNTEIHRLAWDTFLAGTEVAKKLKLYGAGQDLLSDAFSGNVKGMGPGIAEMTFEERRSEPVLIFMADKTSAGAWNLPLYKMFADPFNTIGLVIATNMHGGFRFEIHDVLKGLRIDLSAPEEIYDMLTFLGAPSRYAIKHVFSRDNGDIAAVASTERLSQIAGRYVGKDDPVLVVRCQNQFPAVGEVLEPFSFPLLVEGWMRGSHHGPLMPVSLKDAHPARFDGPPRVIAAGFQLAGGKLIGPRDMFDDPSFDETRREANWAASYMRKHGPFEPHRLPLEEMEYTTMPAVTERLAGRFVDLEAPAGVA